MHIETLLLPPGDGVPNHPRLPLRIYRRIMTAEGRAFDARAFERRFDHHRWPPDWRGGVYDYHHYHTTAHEVLGVSRGAASLELGGPAGIRIDVEAGDALLLPAGTGHRCVEAGADFQVVGAYPQGQHWDIVRTPPDAAIRARILAVPDPDHDPVTGAPFRAE
ncbi:cupin domain-containing protein [Luteimonas deserti]|uniref:Cupin domain-containing protein n=1 Tax=Luteimonas deserti TaxID=2752306 RepID=A0A7Z0TXT4_9GAMM|nr:cupin domain-containing protein [Luteimonas deserti]NYZ62150.1 cupin domain-containing protein [Luteimonas deserti]